MDFQESDYKNHPEFSWREYACPCCGMILNFEFTKDQSMMPCPKCENFVIAPPFKEKDNIMAESGELIL